MTHVDRCSSCGSRLCASDEGFDGVCALCAVDAGARPKKRRGRPHALLLDTVSGYILDNDALEWAANLVGA